MLAIVAFTPMTVAAAPQGENGIAPFGLLDVSARFTARYLYDDQERGSTSDTSSYQTRATWEEEFILMTRSFVYHPGFLNMNFGGGPVLVQQNFESDLGGNTNHETLLNFLARLNFLELKKYPFSLYYQRSHPSVFTSLSGRFLTENNEYGFIGRLNEFLGSTSIIANLSHRDTQGDGFGSIVDDDADLASVNVTTNYRGSDRIQLVFSESTSDSGSGSPGLPLQRARISQRNSEVRASNRFGGNKQFELEQFFIRTQQETVTNVTSEVDSTTYNATARWQHSDKLRTYLRYRSNDVIRVGANSKSQDGGVNIVRMANENLRYEAGLNYSTVQQVGFARDQAGAAGSFSYSRPTSFGSFGISGSLRKENSDQKSSAATIGVFDEPIILNDTTPSNLSNEFVLTESVVVSNVDKTQVFIEGLDYRLVVIGSETSMQRLINSNIVDGQTVLVDYRYQTSGTAEFDSFNSGISITANFLRNLNAFARYNTRNTDVLSGELTTPLNDLNNFEVGVAARFPAIRGWEISGELRHTDQDEELSPFVRDSFEVSATASLPNSFRLLLSSSLVKVDQENSVEDVNQVTYRLGLSGRVWGGMSVNIETAYLNDTGGTLARRQLQHRLNVRWAYRRVQLFVRAQHSDETLGETKRRYNQVTAQVTRTF